MIVYHASDVPLVLTRLDFRKSEFGLHVASKKLVESIVTEYGAEFISEIEIDEQNLRPLRLEDRTEFWSLDVVIQELLRVLPLTDGELGFLDYLVYSLEEDHTQYFSLCQELRNFIISRGYNSIVYRNRFNDISWPIPERDWASDIQALSDDEYTILYDAVDSYMILNTSIILSIDSRPATFGR
jgi:hypothetical protein